MPYTPNTSLNNSLNLTTMPASEERSIIHLNVADFAIAVEGLCDRRLVGRPVAIAGSESSRTPVYDMSEAAFRNGVRKGMALGEARRRCRELRIVPPHPDRYGRAMRQLLSQTLPYSPLTERVDDNGHIFLDVTGTHRLFGPAVDVAWRLRKNIKKELGLDPIWCLAPNKLVAKAGSRLVKPRGEYIVGGGEEEAFLAPQPLALLPGLELQDLLLLDDLNITRIGELASLTMAELLVLFGPRAWHIHAQARGIDPSPVQPVRAAAARIVVDHNFAEDTNDRHTVEQALRQLVARAGCELRGQQLKGGRLGLTLKYTDNVQVSRQLVANSATANDFELFALARLALQRAWRRRLRLASLRLVCDRLGNPPIQLRLFDDVAVKERRRQENSLLDALDTIRQRFTADSIQSGGRLAVQKSR